MSLSKISVRNTSTSRSFFVSCTSTHQVFIFISPARDTKGNACDLYSDLQRLISLFSLHLKHKILNCIVLILILKHTSGSALSVRSPDTRPSYSAGSQPASTKGVLGSERGVSFERVLLH